MCGIAGVVNYKSSREGLENLAARISRRLLHRGPDGSGVKSFPAAALAHRRLALIDLEGGAQPMVSSDGRYAITYNGEIYNYRELRAELSSRWEFQTQSDTEVILAAYATWGEDAIARLNGMFAFFIWDTINRCGFAARDLLGIKPFVFARRANGLTFASEAKALLSLHGQAPVLNRDAVLEYLVAPYFSGVESPMFKDMEYLPAGHLMRVAENGIRIKQWKDYDLTEATIADLSFGEEMAVHLQQATEAALTADVPVGTYLSGGFDSTLITALAARNSTTTIAAFTIRFQDQNRFDYANSLIVGSDDTPFAIDAAKEIGIEHSLVDVRRDGIEQALTTLATTNDALPAWEQEFAQHFLAQAASQNYKAVLVGDAADETHYGYQFLLDAQATRSPSGILDRFDMPPLRADLIEDPLAVFDDKYRKLTASGGLTWETPVNRYLATTYLIIKRWLPRLLHNGDIHAMNASLEARVPFGDIRLLDLARRIHPSIGYHQETEKYFLRQSAEGLMPEVPRLRKKSALPTDQRTGELYQRLAAEQFVLNKDFLEAFFDVPQLMLLCNGRRPLAERERALLFRTLSLCFWRRTYGVQLN